MNLSRSVASLVALLLVSSISVVDPLLSPSPAAAESKPVVYLTFDDGPGPYTSRYLDLLARYDIQTTFFVTGRNTTANEAMARRIVAEGHAIANHSYNHARLTTLSDASIRAELTRTTEAVTDATGVVPTCYRPPYGAVDARVHAQAVSVGLPNDEWQTGSWGSHWGLWDIDTNDWRLSLASTSWTEGDMRRQLDRASDGDTILLHDGGVARDRALAVFTAWLADNHDRFEFRSLPGCGGAVVEPGLHPDHPQGWHRFQIARLYRAYFNRAPDAEGWEYWNEIYSRGNSLEEISHWFTLSSEFALLGETTDTEFVTFVYQQVLERQPDSGGQAYWVAELAAGVTRGELVIHFSESEEYVQRTAPLITGDCYNGDVKASYRCWADQLPPPHEW
ncbi:MAG: polysaccharide deacetylase family protein [Actinomycetia bacterium]|nr:polysaccharide deacetylase family protein [Actinomycetes bacterium]MCP5031419.1 polysaccharide deacetylase family protein [Actinomycetes bacterium]